ncbi:MAG TPA: acetyl/propionyl/methylcrotonyl-CoA carboxylase subunit alpha [Stellaceae bacterium]|jgi:propionyl-CoA carboxylase alpha chain|nr:acetyl/propionyl/methylcrotonyl-CoA carboxylase subunit alpha [Stellaceae bacterium]
MFKKILIANRGEIACRVIATAKRMGIKTVAVYSDADAEALHVRQADEAVRIGPPKAAESYLDIARIVAACKETGAEAVHPGYGFLSENEDFAAAIEAAGIVFIGPPPAAIASLGDKIAAKKIAQQAGVSTVPGHLDTASDAEKAIAAAREIGYPVMIKAAAGGGGKGMRIAGSDAELREGFRLAASEAQSAFGDSRVFIEKYIAAPRHIEIQIVADAHGNAIHFGERECSIQRRHQKVVEEAPSPFLDEKTRAAMGAQAVALAKAAGYRSAGTVEFIVDQKRKFYFLEINTRLQVEHPVTELVTGYDLVELMIRIAAGEKLPLTQKDIKLTGSAIEVRLYAEDPRRNFVPSIGRLSRYLPPQGDGIRIDTGVEEGAEISIYYDPMIAKLIGYGATREEAATRLAGALDAFVIRGVSHNIGLLAAIIARPKFRAGTLSTDFIAEEFPGGFKGETLPPETAAQAVAVAAAAQRIAAERDAAIAGAVIPERWVVVQGESRYPAKLTRRNESIIVAGYTASQEVKTRWQPGDAIFRGTVDGVGTLFQIERAGIGWRLERGGAVLELKVLPPAAAEALARMPAKPTPDLSQHLVSPMPGLLVSLAVIEGQEVKAGEELAVIEAMKMENVLRAERDGTIKKLCARPGDSLAVDQTILEFA